MRLYKYLHPDRTDVLRDSIIRFSSARGLNDPFELKPNFAAFAPREYIHSEIGRLMPGIAAQQYSEAPEQLRTIIPLEVFQAFSQSLLPGMKLTAEKVMEAVLPGIRDVFSQKFEELLGILCLTESPTNLLMWAHYADSHQGFVVEFDPESPFFDQRLGPDDELRHLRKVVYRSERPAVILTEIEDFSPFLTKGQDWSYEAEWRMMMPLSDASQVVGEGSTAVHLFQFPKSMVRGVILGCRMTEPKKTEIRQILNAASEYDHVHLAGARIDDTLYRMLVTDEPRVDSTNRLT